MNDGISFLAIAGMLLVGLLWLGVYLYGLYRLGLAMGRRYRSVRRPRLPYVFIAVGAAMLGGVVILIPVDPFTKFCFGLMVFVAHAHPLAVGVWVAHETERREDHRKWKARTEEWLSDWERMPRE